MKFSSATACITMVRLQMSQVSVSCTNELQRCVERRLAYPLKMTIGPKCKNKVVVNDARNKYVIRAAHIPGSSTERISPTVFLSPGWLANFFRRLMMKKSCYPDDGLMIFS